ncbi:MAG: hypothetical protein ACE5JH_06380 [Acidobacteriota bacterium]
MFLTLLVVTLGVAVFSSLLVAFLFRRPVASILDRIVGQPLGSAWQRYITFAVYVVGVSGGVRIYALERYVTPRSTDDEAIVLNADRWILEVYRTVIETMQSIAWMLLVFFAFALIAYVILRVFEIRHGKARPEPGPARG